MVNPSRGRPRLSGSAKLIRLRSSVFELWCERKTYLGFGSETNSEFAEFLLHLDPSEQTRNIDLKANQHPLLCSTPMDSKRGASVPFIRSSKRQRLELGSPPGHPSKSLDVDVTGTSKNSTSSSHGKFVNPLNSVMGNPFSVCEELSSSSSESDKNDADSEHDFEVRMDSIIEQMCKTDSEGSDSEVNSLSDMDISERDDEATLTMIEDVFPEDEPEDLSISVYPGPDPTTIDSSLQLLPDYSNNCPSTTPELHVTNVSEKPQSEEPIDETVEGNLQKVLTSLQTSFSKLTSVTGLKDLIELYCRSRVVVSIEKLLELKGKYCSQAMLDGHVCDKELQYWAKRVGTRVDLDWKCTSGHCGKWESSEVLAYNRYSKVFANDSLFSVALVLSGNNFAKFSLFCKALNLCSLSKTNFCHFQTKCALPVVRNVWSNMSHNVISILKQYQDICLSGDGRNDSPGHSARYCVYTLMEHCTKVIVDLEVIDKRETGGNSAVMEREGLRRLLEKLMKEMTVSELCTDASSTIIKLVSDMKAKFPLLAKIFHSLDIWHKAKKLSKSLHKAAKVKSCAGLKVWIDPIVSHFWYCAQVAKGNGDELKSTWEGVLHHVCGEHTWAESACNHGPEAEADESKPPLSKSSKAMEALRKIVLDVKWLKTLHFYVRFRHTGELENFNSMMTKYAPKRIAFEYPYFIMRILLAAIDHNFHLFRKPKRTAEGKIEGHRKYSKRTQKYHAEVVKEEKSFSYFPNMAARMLENRRSFKGSFSSRADVDEFDPKKIAPTIAMKAPPPTEELMKAPSRFKLKNNTNTDCSQ